MIAARLGKAVSTVSREVAANGGRGATGRGGRISGLASRRGVPGPKLASRTGRPGHRWLQPELGHVSSLRAVAVR